MHHTCLFVFAETESLTTNWGIPMQGFYLREYTWAWAGWLIWSEFEMDETMQEEKHLKRRKSTDNNEREEDQSSSELSHKKARFSWQIKGTKGNSISKCKPDVDKIIPSEEQDNVDDVNVPSSSAAHTELCDDGGGASENMDESASDECSMQEQDNSKYYDASIEISDISNQDPDQSAIFSPTYHSVVHSSSSSRRHSFPMVSGTFTSPAMPQPQVGESVITNLLIWQNKHVAKSIVDNAINKTLEEMGVSPETEQDEFMADKSDLENQGISEAIKNQGLIGPSQQSESRTQQLSPLLSHLRQASDLVFQQSSTTLHGSVSTDTVSGQGCSRSSTVLTNNIAGSRSYDTMPSNASQVADFEMNSRNLNVPASNSDILDHAVSVVISSQGLSLQ